MLQDHVLNSKIRTYLQLCSKHTWRICSKQIYLKVMLQAHLRFILQNQSILGVMCSSHSQVTQCVVVVGGLFAAVHWFCGWCGADVFPVLSWTGWVLQLLWPRWPCYSDKQWALSPCAMAMAILLLRCPNICPERLEKLVLKFSGVRSRDGW